MNVVLGSEVGAAEGLRWVCEEPIDMAYLEERNGRFRVAFRHHRISLGSADRLEADASLLRVEEGLRLIARGRLEIPADADLGVYLLSDGRITSSRPAKNPSITFGQLRDLFLQSQERAVEENTLYTLRIHCKHLAATLGGTSIFPNSSSPISSST